VNGRGFSRLNLSARRHGKETGAAPEALLVDLSPFLTAVLLAWS
jgi:hypothetical protein